MTVALQDVGGAGLKLMVSDGLAFTLTKTQIQKYMKHKTHTKYKKNTENSLDKDKKNFYLRFFLSI